MMLLRLWTRTFSLADPHLRKRWKLGRIPRNFRRWMTMCCQGELGAELQETKKSAPGSVVFSSDLVLSEMPTFDVNELRSIVEAAQRSSAEAGAAASLGQCG